MSQKAKQRQEMQKNCVSCLFIMIHSYIIKVGHPYTEKLRRFPALQEKNACRSLKFYFTAETEFFQIGKESYMYWTPQQEKKVPPPEPQKSYFLQYRPRKHTA